MDIDVRDNSFILIEYGYKSKMLLYYTIPEYFVHILCWYSLYRTPEHA